MCSSLPVRYIVRNVLIALLVIILVSGCNILADALPPTPSPFPTLARLPTVTPEPPTFTPTPTRTPTPTPTPPPPGSLEAIVAVGANMRTGPGADHAIIDVLLPDTRLVLLGRSGEWFLVETEDGTRGWMALEVLTIMPDVIDVVPTVVP